MKLGNVFPKKLKPLKMRNKFRVFGGLYIIREMKFVAVPVKHPLGNKIISFLSSIKIPS